MAADFKETALTVAYANKPVTLVWGIIWGSLIFGEKISWNMLLGAAIIFGGIYLVSSDGQSSGKEEKAGEVNAHE